MNFQDAFETAFGMSFAIAKSCRDAAGAVAGECTLSSKRIAMQAQVFRNVPVRGFLKRWTIPASLLTSAILLASCVGSGEIIDSRNLTVASVGDSDPQSTETVTQDVALFPPTANPSPVTESSNDSDSTTVETATVSGSSPDDLSARDTPPDGRRISLRPKNNVNADDLLDHWGHRRNELLFAGLSEASSPNDDVDNFENLLEDARKKGSESAVTGLQDGDTITVLGHRRGVAYGRWSGGSSRHSFHRF